MCVCLSVCLSGCSLVYLKIVKLHQFLCMLFMATARSSFGGAAIRYVLPVLWMTSVFHVMALRRVVHIPKRRQNTTNITAKIPTKFYFVIKPSSHRELHAWPNKNIS